MPSAEEDYLDRAREIWRRFQVHVYIGLAMILAAITGLTLQHTQFDATRDSANTQLYELLASADEGEAAAARTAYDALRVEEGFPELANLGAFVLSSVHYEAGEFEQAAAVLQPALESSGDEGLRQFAALRMAEAQIAGGQEAEAIDLLRAQMPAGGRLRILFEERIGDAHYRAGNLDAALRAYARALQVIRSSGDAQFYTPVLRIKLGAMLASPEAQQQARREALKAAAEAAEAESAEGADNAEGSEEAS